MVLYRLLEFAFFSGAKADGSVPLCRFYHGKRCRACRTRVGQGLVPEDKIAVRIIGTAIKSLATA